MNGVNFGTPPCSPPACLVCLLYLLLVNLILEFSNREHKIVEFEFPNYMNFSHFLTFDLLRFNLSKLIKKRTSQLSLIGPNFRIWKSETVKPCHILTILLLKIGFVRSGQSSCSAKVRGIFSRASNCYKVLCYNPGFE